MTGTAAEITPVRSVDRIQVGNGQARPGHQADAGRVLRHRRGHAAGSPRLVDQGGEWRRLASSASCGDQEQGSSHETHRSRDHLGIAAEGRLRPGVRVSRRRHPSHLRRALQVSAGPSRPHPPRAGRHAHGRRLRARHRQGRRGDGDQRPGRHQPGHRHRHRDHGLLADRRDHRAGAAAPRSAPTPSRRPTSPASRCRSPSTTTW